MDEAQLNNFLPRMGQILKVIREKTAQNQVKIAKKAGISTSMLSQIERGIVSPSIDTLVQVCHALDIDIADLFRRLSLNPPVRIHHPSERLRTEMDGVRYEQLITNAVGPFPAELFLLELEPGQSTMLSNNGHEGVEMGYVLKGNALLVVDDTHYVIKAGDSISFNSHYSHRLSNNGEEAFKAVWSISPPHVDFISQ
jgi:transcriptional regulator with XRE-family HTH domain